LEIGIRYTVATRENLLLGYLRLGKWAVWCFAIFTILSMFIITTTLILITAGLAKNMIPINGISNFHWSVIVALVSVAMLLIGKYPFLDMAIKVSMFVMCAITIIATIILIPEVPHRITDFMPQTYWNIKGLIFIVALMGWMPSPADISV
jgi:Mn2+/Fe2+ NRAMP family transporter